MGVIIKNNVMYGAGDIEISPICYSEEEREVGCWVDGKPLYQKTINTGALTLDSNFHQITHNISNIDKVIKTTGIVQTVNNEYYSIPHYRPNYQSGMLMGADTTIIQYMNNWLTVSDSYFTLQYTKTTDTPGSGIWTPSGVPAVHYSTNEQVVGTWVDGSTVYEKSYEVTGINADYNYIIDANFTQSAIKLLPGCSAVLRTTGTYNTDYALDVLDDNSAGIRLFTNINGLNFNVTKYSSHSSHYGTCSAVVTIRYTKSTT